MVRQSLLFFLFLSVVSSSLAAGTCYYPNGAQSLNNFPCDADADEGPCCHGGQGWACLSNKLCRGPDGNVIRGSCSDPTWESPECAHFCLSANTGGTDLISCANVTGSDTSYCCDHTVNCCNSGVGRFNVLPSEPEVMATWNRASSQYVLLQTSTEVSSTTSLPEATSALPSTLATPSASPSDETTAGLDAAEPTSNSEAGSAEEEDGGAEMSVAVKAGIGAGAGVGAILVAVIVFLVLKVRRNKRAMQKSQSLPPSMPDIYQNYSRRPETQMHAGEAPKWSPWHEPEVQEMRSQPDARMEMDGRPRQTHWARVELPAD